MKTLWNIEFINSGYHFFWLDESNMWVLFSSELEWNEIEDFESVKPRVIEVFVSKSDGPDPNKTIGSTIKEGNERIKNFEEMANSVSNLEDSMKEVLANMLHIRRLIERDVENRTLGKVANENMDKRPKIVEEEEEERVTEDVQNEGNNTNSTTIYNALKYLKLEKYAVKFSGMTLDEIMELDGSTDERLSEFLPVSTNQEKFRKFLELTVLELEEREDDDEFDMSISSISSVFLEAAKNIQKDYDVEEPPVVNTAALESSASTSYGGYTVIKKGKPKEGNVVSTMEVESFSFDDVVTTFSDSDSNNSDEDKEEEGMYDDEEEEGEYGDGSGSLYCPVPQKDTNIEELIKKKGDVISQGSFGQIRLIWLDLGGTELVRACEKVIAFSNHMPKESVRKEVSILKMLKHPYLLNCFGSYTSNNCENIVLEYCDGGDLFEKKKCMKISQKLKCVTQIVQGMKVLHEKGIIHRDLKTQNIFLSKFDNEYVCKIGDFGSSRNISTIGMSLVGTIEYMSPEILDSTLLPGREKKFLTCIDIYSFGIILWEIFSGKQPYLRLRKETGNSQFEMLSRIHKENIRPDVDLIDDLGMKEIVFLKKLMQECWKRKPLTRPVSFEEIENLLVQNGLN